MKWELKETNGTIYLRSEKQIPMPQVVIELSTFMDKPVSLLIEEIRKTEENCKAR
jgi:hypothetical protein